VVLLAAPFASAQALPSPAPPITIIEALSRALQNNPVVQSHQAQVAIDRGVQMQAAGQFDTTLLSGATQTRVFTPLPAADLAALQIEHEITDTTLVSVGESKLFRNGASIASTYSLERVRDTYNAPSAVDASQLSLSISVPLLRGRGHGVVDAQELAAGAEVEASLLDLNQTIAQLLEQTALDYWNVQAAARYVVIARDAETRGHTYVDNVTALSRADHVPHSDLNEVNANLADRAANRLAAEQQLVAARGQLAIDIGQGAAEMTTFPEIADPFPLAENQQPPSDRPAALKFYIDQALQHRADVLAARKRIQEASILKHAAANALLPQININFGTGYVLAKEGRSAQTFFKSTYSGDPGGPNAVAGITFSFPPANHAARGQYIQAAGAVHQDELQTVTVERSVASALMVEVQDVRNAIARVTEARESVRSFRAALEGEREKYRVGLGSVVDVLTVEDRLTTALTSEVLADQVYADAIVQFRFLTGTLIAPDQSAQVLPADIFATLPFYAEPSPGSTP
jgi:outer membrane protein TolC